MQSTKAALEMLGYKVYHMEDIMSNGLDKMHLWALTSDVALERLTQKILSLGYNATLDSPCAVFSLRWAKRFPNAKVIFTHRDSTEEWAKSHEGLLNAFRFSQVFPWNALNDFKFNILGEMQEFEWDHVVKLGHSMLPWVNYVEDLGIQNVSPEGSNMSSADMFRRWESKVTKTVPAERLLKFNVKQGWDPLVRFLGKTAPASSFPRLNDKNEVAIMKLVFLVGVYGWPFFAFIILTMAAFIGEWYLALLRQVVRRMGFSVKKQGRI